MPDERPMLPIPVSVAKEIAEKYGYDQIVVYARRTGDAPCGEHMTTYGKDAKHCAIAAHMGHILKKFMGWESQSTVDQLTPAAKAEYKRLFPNAD